MWGERLSGALAFRQNTGPAELLAPCKCLAKPRWLDGWSCIMAAPVAAEAPAALQAEPCRSSAGSPGTSSGSSASDQSRFGADDAAEGERGWSAMRETRWPWPKKLSALLSACSGNLGARCAVACCSLAFLRLGSVGCSVGDLGRPWQPPTDTPTGTSSSCRVDQVPQRDTLEDLKHSARGVSACYLDPLKGFSSYSTFVQGNHGVCAQYSMSLAAGFSGHLYCHKHRREDL